MKAFWKSGELFVWLTASGVAISLLMVAGLLGLIMAHGLGQFWPQRIEEVRLHDGQRFIGQIMGQEVIPGSETPDRPEGRARIRLRTGNRDAFGFDFKWIDETAIETRQTPEDVVKVERREWGPAYGRIVALHDGPGAIRNAGRLRPALQVMLTNARETQRTIDDIEHDRIGAINHEIETLRLKRRALRLDETMTPKEAARDEAWNRRISALEEVYHEETAQLEKLYRSQARFRVGLELSDGREVQIPLAQIIDVTPINAMRPTTKLLAYLQHLWVFLSGQPREANTEGGIFPAIFGTVLMVFLMTIVVMPFGVMAAVYLREYATQGILVRVVRVAVNNLAGVPSIVFGVFGLGCFIYAAGGTIDQLFFPEALPNPTFGTGGILWASLTLALLTVPVVIVATEEGLSAVPREFREGSIGLGATKFETLRHVILPCALPGILTGLILAMARAAGEVAPLMLTGVVKLAPSLPLDTAFPYLHLDRKFMHLGFHIYDVGFQSPNVEAAKPMVYMTTLTLITVVVTLNLVAVVVRNRLRRRFATSAV
jgi:phosphate transport system permease protein